MDQTGSQKQRDNASKNDHLSKIQYIQPISQKKHAELSSNRKVKINPFTDESSSMSKNPFQGEVTFGEKVTKFAEAASLYSDFLQQDSYSVKNRISQINTDIDNHQIYKKRQFNSKTPSISQNIDLLDSKQSEQFVNQPPRQTFTNKKRPDNLEYMGYSNNQINAASSVSSLSFRGGSFKVSREDESKKKRIQELLKKAKNLTSPHQNLHIDQQLAQAVDQIEPESFIPFENANEDEEDSNSEQVGIRKTIHSISDISGNRNIKVTKEPLVKKNTVKSVSNDANVLESYSNSQIEVQKQRDSSLQDKNSPNTLIKKNQNPNNSVVKIKHLNQSEIQVSFANSKKKLAYYKNSEESHKSGNKEKVSKKVIQINTNLEPSQSKQQYKIALAHAYFKEQTKKDKSAKINATSISCGGITLNFSNKDEQSSQYENQFASKHNKQTSKNLTTSEPSNKDKTVESQSSQMSQISPQSFYTPNSFYKATKQSRQNQQITGHFSANVGAPQQADNEPSSTSSKPQLSSIKIPQHPNTITNMQKHKQIGELIKSNIKIKQLQSCGNDELNNVAEPKTIKAHLSPFSTGQVHYAHTP